MSAEPNDPRLVPSQSVVYDVGELLDKLGTRLDSGFARVEAKLDTKADKVDLATINAKIDEHTKEIGQLKDRQRADEIAQQAVTHAKTESANKTQTLWNIGLAFALVLFTALSVVLPLIT